MGDTEDTNNDGAGAGSDTTDTDTEDVTTEDESDTSQNNDDEDAADAADDGEDDGKGNSNESDSAEDEAEADDDEEPEIRKPKAGAPNSEWAKWRAQEKRKAQAKEKSGADDNTDDTEDSDDDDLSPEERAKFDKRIEKHMAPFKQKAAEQEVDTEIASFLANNPDFKPFEAKVRRWALHPNREGVPVKSIFYEVAGDKLLVLGAKRAKAANEKANRTKTPAGQPAGDKGNKSYKDMPLSDFGKELEDAKLRR